MQRASDETTVDCSTGRGGVTLAQMAENIKHGLDPYTESETKHGPGEEDGPWAEGWEARRGSQAPIVRVVVDNNRIHDAQLYAPGLPAGVHDLYCEPGAPYLREPDQARTISLLCDRLDFINRVCHDSAIQHDEKVRQIEGWTGGFMPLPEPIPQREGDNRASHAWRWMPIGLALPDVEKDGQLVLAILRGAQSVHAVDTASLVHLWASREVGEDCAYSHWMRMPPIPKSAPNGDGDV